MITFTGPLQVWTSNDGRSHFMRVPYELCDELRAQALIIRRGFGSVKVEASMHGFTWQTSVFPSKSSGGFFLPVKAEALRMAGVEANDNVTVTLQIV